MNILQISIVLNLCCKKVDSLNMTVKRLNRGIRSYLLQHNGCYILYDDLDDCHDDLYAHNGVNLYFLGQDMFY
jgi:hypothetical protein